MTNPNLKLVKIPYITLWVEKFDDCLKFYKKIGLEVEFADHNFAQFKTRGTKLYLHRIKEKTVNLRERSLEIHFEVQDVDKTYRNLQSKEIKFVQKPADMPWGNRMASFRDPEGYVIEIIGPIEGQNAKYVKGKK